MNEPAARAAAEAVRHEQGVSRAALLSRVERRWIEWSADGPEQPAPVADVLVWIARFNVGNAWTDLALRDSDGRVIRVERSRLPGCSERRTD